MLHNTPEQFAAQLQEGHYNELRVALYFMLRGAHVRIGFTGQRYDLHILPPEQNGFGIEVKWDKAAATTGNLYFEVKNTRRGESSGVAASTADYWCHVIGEGEEALFAPAERVRAILAAGNFRKVNTRALDSNSRGILVPTKWLETQEGIAWIKLPTVDEFFGELFRSARGAKTGGQLEMKNNAAIVSCLPVHYLR